MFKNRIRLPFHMRSPQFPVERNIFRKADGSSKVISVIVKNTYEGTTDQLPEDWHRKLVIALSHDNVKIEGNRFLSDVVLDSDYGIEWEDFLSKPIADAKFTIQVTPFNASNSNCQTCDEIAQLALVDDTTATVYSEGTTNNFPFNILLNDSICCNPFVVSISSFNTAYFSAVSVTQLGVVIFTVKPSVPDIANVLLATYRVTCPNGSYDEANIYIGIDGTSVVCVAPEEVLFDSGAVDWNGVVPSPAGGYDWFLYNANDIYTVIASGNQPGLSVNISAFITPGQSYIFTIKSNCGGGSFSTFSMVQFFAPGVSPSTCGNFSVTYFPSNPSDSSNFSYISCSGSVENGTINGIGQQFVCMLMNEFNTPVFFTSDSPLLTYSYTGSC